MNEKSPPTRTPFQMSGRVTSQNDRRRERPDAPRRLLERGVDQEERGVAPADRVGQPAHRQDERQDDPEARQGDAEPRKVPVERPDVRDADRRARDRQDQRVQGVERAAARQARSRQHPGDREPHPDAQDEREAGVEEAVRDVLRRLDEHALEELERVLGRERRQRPPAAERRQRDPEVGQERQQHDDGQRPDDHRLQAGGSRRRSTRVYASEA